MKHLSQLVEGHQEAVQKLIEAQNEKRVLENDIKNELLAQRAVDLLNIDWRRLHRHISRQAQGKADFAA